MMEELAVGDSALRLQAAGQQVKRRAACDECRTKKLKCTGEQPTCSRCARENITCIYSPQKQMGRPKKRQRTEDEQNSGSVDLSRDGSQIWDSTGLNGPFGDGFNFDSAFTPGGSLQPWLQSAGQNWDASMSDGLFPSEHSVPGLTPDSSSNSPPTLNLPPELQNTTKHSHHNNNHNTTSTQLLLDPALSPTDGSNLGMPPSLNPNCACLSTLYLTLSNLQSMDPSFTFPFALHPLREAMQSAFDVLSCDECPKRFISAIQNTQLIGTLLMSIAERFSKILEAITREAVRTEVAGEQKKFRLADLNTSTSHLHTDGLGCAAAFSISISPSEWRSMAKKVVRAEVYGPSDAYGPTEMECCPSFLSLLNKMEHRHEYWNGRSMPEDFPKDLTTGQMMGGKNMPKEDHICLKYVTYAKKLLSDGLDWS